MIVVGIEFYGPIQFLESALQVTQLQVRLAQLVVCLGEPAVDQRGVRILDGGFAILPLSEVFLSTIKILLLAHVGVARTPSQQRKEKKKKGTDQQQASITGTAHNVSPKKSPRQLRMSSVESHLLEAWLSRSGCRCRRDPMNCPGQGLNPCHNFEIGPNPLFHF